MPPDHAPNAEAPPDTQSQASAPAVRSHVSWWLIALLRPVHWLLMHFYLRVDVEHADRIPTAGPAIVVPTHRSRWDPVVLHCATRRILRYMTSHDEFIGLQGWLMRHVGAFPVNTRRPTPGVIRLCRELARAGEILVIFPEGTIFYYPPGNVHPLKPGTAWLALDCQAGMPERTLHVIPVRIVYSDRYPRFRTRVRIEVQEEIALNPYLTMARKPAIRSLTARLEAALGEIVNESLAEMAPPRAPVPPASVSPAS